MRTSITKTIFSVYIIQPPGNQTKLRPDKGCKEYSSARDKPLQVRMTKYKIKVNMIVTAQVVRFTVHSTSLAKGGFTVDRLVPLFSF